MPRRPLATDSREDLVARAIATAQFWLIVFTGGALIILANLVYVWLS